MVFSQADARTRRDELGGAMLALLAVALAAVFLRSELVISRLPLNDGVLHLAAAERLLEAFARGDWSLDSWVGDWGLGYPVWRSYQPVPHLLLATALRLCDAWLPHATIFAAVQYVLLILLPASVYVGARLMGIGSWAAGLAALLVWTPDGTGDFGRYGLGLGSVVWRGSGLFTQLVALHFLVLAVGTTRLALDTGRHRSAAAALLALAALSHLVFGYVGVLSSLVLALVGPQGARAQRLARLADVALRACCLLVWFVVPLVRGSVAINHSRFEPGYKWDSFGAPVILEALARGQLLDAYRLPILTSLVALGAIGAVLAWKDSACRRLAILAVTFLLLFFGRATWGHLLLPIGVPADMHLHRLQGAFELFAVLLASAGLVAGAKRIGTNAVVVVGVLSAVAVGMLWRDRAGYLALNTTWGMASAATIDQERADLDAALDVVQAILAERPGRVSGGLAQSWGLKFQVGALPVYAFFAPRRFDQVSFLYHSMSTASDIMVSRDENRAADDVVFGVRAIIAPDDRTMPPHLRRRSLHGRFAVYEASAEGYFGIVDVEGRYVGPRATRFEASQAWLQSSLPNAGVVVAFDASVPGLVPLGRWVPMPPPPPTALAPRGRILSETKDGEVHRASVELVRSAYVFVKMTWHPDLVTTVDGLPAELLHVTPGFGAVPVSPGRHEVVVRYHAGLLKPILVVIGLLAFVVLAGIERTRAGRRAEEWGVARLRGVEATWWTPAARRTLLLSALTILAARPLFRGQLISGHDTGSYPPRVVEMERALAGGQIPPVWAPDLGMGFGEPLFEFTSPLLYVLAAGFHVLGCSLADSLQLVLALLVALAAAAMYRLARELEASPAAAIVTTLLWLFAPYLALDLYVRAAFAEAVAVAIAPVALLAVVRAAAAPSWTRAVWAGLAMALLPLAHTGAAILLLPTLVLVGIGRVLASERWRSGIISLMIAVGVALGTSAFVWLPVQLETRFIHAEILTSDYYSWERHGVIPWQLLWSAWGYGTSEPGAGDGMSFALGPLHLALVAAGLWVVRSKPGPRWERTVTAAAAIAVFGALWMSTTWSAWLWRHVPILPMLQYPWRALMIPAICVPLLALPFVRRLTTRGLVAVAAVCLVTNIAHIGPHSYSPYDEEFYEPLAIARRPDATSAHAIEPRWVEKRPAYRSQRLVVEDGSASVFPVALASARQEFLVEAKSRARLESSSFYYPGWKAYVDGGEVALTPQRPTGTFTVEVGPGSHHVVFEFTATPARRLGVVVTVFTLAFCALVAMRGRRRRRQRAAA